jgi:RimJ/RimL family protein N-acetyltransferase
MGWIKFEPLTRAERVTLIERWIREWEEGGDAVFGVFHDGEAVGGAGLHRRLGPGALEIGYWTHVDHIRKGYATELSAALTSTAFAVAGIDRVEIHNDLANEASGGVPDALGYHRERVDSREPQAPAETGQLVIWTMTRQTWELRGS